MRTFAAFLLAVALACSTQPPQPARLEIGNETCQFCRMVVSDRRFAAQIVANGHEPLFFDDIGCLANFVNQGEVPSNAVAYVADYREDAWVPAREALYSRCPGLASPMNSGIVASARRSQTFCPSLETAALFGTAGPPGGTK